MSIYQPKYTLTDKIKQRLNDIDNILNKLSNKPSNSNQSSLKLWDMYDCYKITDLYKFHHQLMDQFLPNAGKVRKVRVNVIDVTTNKIWHEGAPVKEVHNLVSELFEWLNTTNEHPVIKAIIFHYQLVTIHPFLDANGRSSRTWLRLILIKYHQVFKMMPIDKVIKPHKNEYNNALRNSQDKNDSTEWIECLIDIIYSWLDMYYKDINNPEGPTFNYLCLDEIK